MRKYLFILAFMVASAGMTSISYADDIKYVRLETTQEPKVGEANVESLLINKMSGQPYEVTEFDFKNKESYKIGDAVKASFMLTANEGSSFADIKPAACLVDNSIAASNIEIKDGGKTLTLEYELPAVHVELAEPTELALTEDGVATWSKVENANKYTVRIQKMNTVGGRDLVKVESTNKSYFDMSDYMYDKVGDYLFSVMASSDIYYLDDSDYAELPVGESILVNDTDIGENSNILDDKAGKARKDGQFVTDREMKIAGQWYYFGSDGVWISGWREDEGGWKYYDPKTHKRAKGVTKVGEDEYYLDKETGYMQTGLVETPDGEVFYGSDGARAKGWISYDGETYYIKKDGTRNTDMLIDLNNKTYIFYKDGRLVK